MKKLFSLLTLALLTLSVGATTVTFVPGTTVGNNTTAAGADVMTLDGVTISTTAGGLAAAEYRFASGSTTTISSTAGNITSIEFTCTAQGTTKYGPGCWNTETGEYVYDGNEGLWSGSAASIDFVSTAQVRCSQIVVTIDEGTPVVNKVAAPTFTPFNADGYHFTGSLAVTVSCETENAEIALYKVVDGEIDYSTYQYFFQSGVVYVTENTTYVAQASKGDMDDSDYAYATYVLDGDNPDPIVTDYIKFNHADDAETSAGEFTVTRNGASFTVSNGLVGAESYRIYKNATISFTSTVGNIVKIEFDGYNSTNPISGFGANTGLTFDGNDGTWTGDAETVTLTVNDKQVRATEIRVYVNGEAPITVMDPTFNPGDGYIFTTETLDVTINCATQGANIVYVVNNGDEVVAPAPVTVTLNETSTITAYAELDGVESGIVEATYTKEEPIQADFVTFNSTEDKGDGSEDTSPWTVVKDGVTMACSSGRVYDAGYRVYQGSTLTFTSTVGNIIRIEFDGVENENYPVSRLTANVGNLVPEGKGGIWTGKTTEVIFTAGQQTRATEIRVYVDGDTTAVPTIEVAAPVFSPVHNTTFIGEQTVTITCETEDAVIYYGYDNENFVLYEAPFTIDETCTVYAYAQVDTVKSATVSAKYYKAIEVATIAEANALDNKTNFAFTGEAIVTYQWKNTKNDYISTWIKDASGYGLIYGKQLPELTTGDVIADGWDAQKTTYNSIPEFQYPNNVTASGDNVDVAPVEMAAVDTLDVNKYIIMKGQTLTLDSSDTTGCTWLNEAELKFYNQFFKTEGLNIESGKKYDVVGIVTVYKKAPEIYIISATEVVESLWEIGDVNHDTKVDVSDVTLLIGYVLGNNPENFFETEANVNDGDDKIDVGDVTALIARILAQ